jgi:hypothetical protein
MNFHWLSGAGAARNQAEKATPEEACMGPYPVLLFFIHLAQTRSRRLALGDDLLPILLLNGMERR